MNGEGEKDKYMIWTREVFNNKLMEINPFLSIDPDCEYRGLDCPIRIKCMAHLGGHCFELKYASSVFQTPVCIFEKKSKFLNNETFKDYITYLFDGKISVIGEYHKPKCEILFRCEEHKTEFSQSPYTLMYNKRPHCKICRRVRKESYINARYYAGNESVNKSPKQQHKLIREHYKGYGEAWTQEEYETMLTRRNSSLTIEQGSKFSGLLYPIRIRCQAHLGGHAFSVKNARSILDRPLCPFDKKSPSYDDEVFGDYIIYRFNGKISVHGKYVNAKSDVLFFCEEHGEDFLQTPDSLLSKENPACKECKKNRDSIWIKKRTYTHEDFVKKLNQKNPDIEVIGRYRNSVDAVAFRCLKCDHEWTAPPGVVLSQNTKCPRCSGKLALTVANLKKKMRTAAPGIKYIKRIDTDHSIVECKTCKQQWSAHHQTLQRRYMCGFCVGKSSSLHERTLLLLFQYFFGKENVIWRSRYEIGKERDLYIKPYNFAVELGDFVLHEKRLENDAEKVVLSRNRGDCLLTIYWNIPKSKSLCKNEKYANGILLEYTEQLNDKQGIKRLCRDVFDIINKRTNDNIEVTDVVFNQLYIKALCTPSFRMREEQIKEKFESTHKDSCLKFIRMCDNGRAEIMCTNCNGTWEEEVFNAIKRKRCKIEFGNLSKRKYDDLELLKRYVDEVRKDLEVISFGKDKKKVKVRCQQCGFVCEMPIQSALANRRLRCKNTHIFEEYMKSVHTDIQVQIPKKYHNEFGEWSIIDRRDNILCNCLVCGKKWSPMVDSLMHGHGCPHNRVRKKNQ